MDIEEQQRKARKVVQEARKVIAESERALKKADEFFRLNRIDRTKLMTFLKEHGSPELDREVDALVEKTMRDVKKDADYLIEKTSLEESSKFFSKKFRTLI